MLYVLRIIMHCTMTVDKVCRLSLSYFKFVLCVRRLMSGSHPVGAVFRWTSQGHLVLGYRTKSVDECRAEMNSLCLSRKRALVISY